MGQSGLAGGPPHDVVTQIPGERHSVTPGPILRASGWRGGIFLVYVAPDVTDDWTVERSGGVQANGFMLNPSEGPAAGGLPPSNLNFTSRQVATGEAAHVASGASVATMITDGGKYLFRLFETISLDAAGVRIGPPAIYTVGEWLKVSENGLLCNDPDARLLLATGGTAVRVVGHCHTIPAARSLWRLGLDHKA